MPTVWYLGRSNVKRLTTAEWSMAGINGRPTVEWNKANGYSLDESLFNAAQLTMLGNMNEFLRGQVGPRVGIPMPPGGSASFDDVLFQVLQTQLAGKVNSLPNNNIVYATDATGNDIARSYTASATSSTLVYRGTGGRTAVGDGVAASEAVNKGQLDAINALNQNKFLLGTCADASGTVAKVMTLDAPNAAYSTPVLNDFLVVTFTNGHNISNGTIAINGGPAIAMRTPSGSQSSTLILIEAGGSALMRYDGTYWRFMGLQNAPATAQTAAEIQAGTSTTGRIVNAALFAAMFLTAAAAAPASMTATGRAGQYWMDANGLYVCYATNTWRRINWSTF